MYLRQPLTFATVLTSGGNTLVLYFAYRRDVNYFFGNWDSSKRLVGRSPLSPIVFVKIECCLHQNRVTLEFFSIIGAIVLWSLDYNVSVRFRISNISAYYLARFWFHRCLSSDVFFQAGRDLSNLHLWKKEDFHLFNNKKEKK